ncbi:MAG: V4R domain-containing protein [Candidatus Micrarchaeia archaeon]
MAKNKKAIQRKYKPSKKSKVAKGSKKHENMLYKGRLKSATRVLVHKQKTKSKQKSFLANAENKIPESLEELLKGRLFGDASPFINTPMVPDVLYNATPSLRELAYKFGFSFGSEIGEKSGNKIDKLFEVLNKAGLQDILYYPFGDKVVIKATNKNHTNLGRLVHIYESGIIAGFLSSTTGKAVYTKETKCVFNGDAACEFAAEPKASVETIDKYDENIVDVLAKSISSSELKVSQDYMLFSMLPLMAEPIKSEVAKILFAAGSKLGDNKESIESYGGKFGIKVSKAKGGFVLLYNELNSFKGFVDLSSAFFAGLAKKMYNRNIVLKQAPTKENFYKIYILHN